MDILIRILNIIGSLGLFLYGMKLMSEALQRAAGGRLRRAMGRMAATPVSQIASTAAVTATVQSSSAITVMIVSFVNAGIVNLRQAIGMIMGANIGTSLTAWIIAVFGFQLNFSVISIPMVGLGFALILIHRVHYRALGEIIIGFALLLLGLTVLQSSMIGVAQNTALFRELATYADLGYLSILLFILIGTLLTAVLQSSSATITLTIVMCQNGWIPFEAGLAMILGENVGTTVTANLAAIVTNTPARRAAVSHTLINLFGLLWATPLLPWIAEGIVVLFAGAGAASLMLAFFHTGFNVLNVCILTCFVPQIMRVVTWIVPQSPDDHRKRLFALDSGLVSTPELSLMQAHNEITNHAKRVLKMFGMVRSLMTLTNAQEFRSEYEHVEKYEQITDRVEREIITYLSRITSQNNGEAATHRLQTMFRTVSHIEQIGDSNLELAKILRDKKEQNLWFNQELRDKLYGLFDLVEQALYVMVTNLENPTDEGVERSRGIEEQINLTSAQLRSEQLRLAQGQEYKYMAGITFIELVVECEKLGDAAVHISAEQAADL
ncbi:Na/Pi cotransporter family protein [uncultured Rikenella sp.]|uniref:Na/Pi cotransporter family protein n=1 Tax=uncultured Rikenella sp. TaxID=368003 RepID=UPI0026211653|nr:Na/Pi cotransporter family protein [uncultured Rikenella sp.]